MKVGWLVHWATCPSIHCNIKLKVRVKVRHKAYLMGIDGQNLLIVSLLTLDLLVNALGFAHFELIFLKINMLSNDFDSYETQKKFLII